MYIITIYNNNNAQRRQWEYTKEHYSQAKHLTETLSEDFAVHLGESKVINMEEKKSRLKTCFHNLRYVSEGEIGPFKRVQMKKYIWNMQK